MRLALGQAAKDLSIVANTHFLFLPEIVPVVFDNNVVA